MTILSIATVDSLFIGFLLAKQHKISRVLLLILAQVLGKFAAVCPVERTPDGTCFCIAVSANVNRPGCDIIRLKPVFCRISYHPRLGREVGFHLLPA